MPKKNPERQKAGASAGKRNKKAASSAVSRKASSGKRSVAVDSIPSDKHDSVSAAERREEIRKLKKKRRSISFRLRPVHLFLIFILLLFVLGGVYLSQQTTMASIEQEKAEKQSVLDGLKVDEERLERMLEYMQTDQYMMQYAREKLGYVFDDDIKFYNPGTS